RPGRPGESGDLNELGRRQLRLRVEQVRDARVVRAETGTAFRRRKEKPLRVVERVARRSAEATVPHQRGEERGIDAERGPPLIARTGTPWPHDAVALDADGHRLRITKAMAWRMAAATGVVVMERRERVEPQQPAQVCEPGIE